MKGKRGAIIGTCIFFACMIFFTFSSRAIHESMLVHVQVIELKKKMFDVSQQQSDGSEVMIRGKYFALPEELAEQEEIYAVVIGVKNEEERTFARRVFFELGEEKDGEYPIINGDYNGEKIIVKMDGEIADGDEIVVEQEELRNEINQIVEK